MIKIEYIYIYIMIQKIRNLDPVYYVLYCILSYFLNTCILYFRTLRVTLRVMADG